MATRHLAIEIKSGQTGKSLAVLRGIINVLDEKVLVWNLNHNNLGHGTIVQVWAENGVDPEVLRRQFWDIPGVTGVEIDIVQNGDEHEG